MGADLHIHSNASDGILGPSEIVKIAKKLGLSAISITDHDTINGLDEAISTSKKIGLDFIPGIELSSESEDWDIHILGYFIDHNSKELREYLKNLQNKREIRAKKIVNNLKNAGIKIEFEQVARESHGESIGRPHLARTLVKLGYVDSVQKAFHVFLKRYGPYYVKKYTIYPDEVIKILLKANAVPVLAHPLSNSNIDFIAPLVKIGLMGIEVYYPGYNRFEINKLIEIADRYGLIKTGGTDFHGSDPKINSKIRYINIGDITVNDKVVKILYKKAKELRKFQKIEG